MIDLSSFDLSGSGLSVISDGLQSCNIFYKSYYVTQVNNNYTASCLKNFIFPQRRDKNVFIILIAYCDNYRNRFTQKNYDDFYDNVTSRSVIVLNILIEKFNMGLVTKNKLSEGDDIFIDCINKIDQSN